MSSVPAAERYAGRADFWRVVAFRNARKEREQDSVFSRISQRSTKRRLAPQVARLPEQPTTEDQALLELVPPDWDEAPQLLEVPVQEPVAREVGKEIVHAENDRSDAIVDRPTPEPNQEWAPLDLRNVELDTSKSAPTQQAKSQATAASQKLAKESLSQGFELAQRRAHFSARARFVQTLRTLARSLDEQSFATRHTKALNRALQAYEEAADFFPIATRPNQEVNLHMVIGGHDTELLQGANVDLLTSFQCLREYMAYAEQEFREALQSDTVAAQALYGLGRLEMALDSTSSLAEQVRANRAMMLYQTVLSIDPSSFAAANELGVLLTKYGRYNDAMVALQHSVRVNPQATSWANLASVYDKLGRREQAQLARSKASGFHGKRPTMPFIAQRPKVEWVNPSEFMGNVPVIQQPAPLQARRVAPSQTPMPRQARVQAQPRKASKPNVRTANLRRWNFPGS